MFQRSKRLQVGFGLLGLIAATTAFATTPSADVLRPHVAVGRHVSHAFSLAISLEGAGFKTLVQRVSGTGGGVVTSADSKGIAMQSTYQYDGRPVSSGTEKFLADGQTTCWNDRCAVDHETSGAFFNRTLWGNPPADLQVGSHWTATIAQPWELGPAGTATVRVVQLDPANHTVTLSREGHGSGPSLHDQQVKQITLTTDDGASVQAKVIPGEASWHGRTIVRDGIIVADTILVERDVTLETATGHKFKGKERLYTLENLLQDHS